MRQRVAIARALATEPELLLMDEPLAAVDAQTRLVMQKELHFIWGEAHSTVVYITHDIEEALSLADRLVVMTARPGRIKRIIVSPFTRDADPFARRRDPRFGPLQLEIWNEVAQEVGTQPPGSARRSPDEYVTADQVQSWTNRHGPSSLAPSSSHARLKIKQIVLGFGFPILLCCCGRQQRASA